MHGTTTPKFTNPKLTKHSSFSDFWSNDLTLNLLAPTTVGADINPYPANVEKIVSS